MAAVVDPEDIFWDEVKVAVRHVELHQMSRVVFQRGTRKAEVYFHDNVVIIISEADIEQPALLVP